MKCRRIFISILVLFSFYYTNKMVDIIKNTDPIMKKIKANNNKYEKAAVNATIVDNNYITPGINGINIDNDKSYSKMKRYGKYNENLLVFKEEEPAISLDDVYDKFIISGNASKRNVALLFIVKRDDNIDKLLDILTESDVDATFFMDGLFIENNQDLVKNISNSNFEVELLSYNGAYQKKYFSYGINMLYEITNIKPKYCFTTNSDKTILNMCNSLSLHTVIPTLDTSIKAFNEIKKNLNNGSIISLNNKEYILSQLSTIIKYIKQKGYEIVTLDKLLSEESRENDE